MEKGTMILQAEDGKQEIGPGQAILLAQLPPNSANNSSNSSSNKEDDDDDEAAYVPCTIFDLANCTAAQIAGMGAVITAAGYGIYHFSNNALNKADSNNVLIPVDTTPGTPASPNQ